MKFRLKKTTFAFSSLFLLSSCASVFNGGSPLVVVDGEITDPVTIVTQAETYTDVTLPIEVKLKKSALEGQHIQITSDNYEFDDIVVHKKFNNRTFLNVLEPIPVGFVIDWATNNDVSPRHGYYFISPKGERETLGSTEPFRQNVTIARPHAKEFCRHEFSVAYGLAGELENIFYKFVEENVENHGFYFEECCGLPNIPTNIRFDYTYNINRRLGIGCTVGFGKIHESMYRNCYDADSDNNFLHFDNITPEARLFSVMPSVRYKWWISKNNRYSAYSALALGYAHTTVSSEKITEGGTVHTNELPQPQNNKDNRFGYQVTFAGFEMGRGNVRSFLEWGVGYSGILRGGFKVCF